jgi:hypothetical protein
MATAGILGTSRILFSDSVVFRFFVLMSAASTALFVLALAISSQPQSSGSGSSSAQPNFATGSPQQNQSAYTFNQGSSGASGGAANVQLQHPVAANGTSGSQTSSVGSPATTQLEGTDFSDLAKH